MNHVQDCIFCKIANGTINSNKVYEDEKVIAFHDLDPQAPVHVLIVPKTHIVSVNDLNDENLHLISHIFKVAKKLAKELNIDSGYRIVNNCGAEAGQSVWHIHFHLLGGRKMKWPPG